MASEDSADAFLAVCDQFKLGELPTEQSNPATARLSYLCADPSTVPEALETLQRVDIAALEAIVCAVPQMEQLAAAAHQVFSRGKKVVCEGCGATGRLSLSLEAFANAGMKAGLEGHVLGFMAGGDVAFIRSIEQFEDRVEHGQRQLHDIGFEDGDLLVAITEGGETPFVIAACEEALRVSASTDPFFVYCNPDDVLCRVAERSRRVIENPRVRKINICVGNMGITGSTRMQATTVQLACVGLALRHHDEPSRIGPQLERLIATLRAIRFADLAPLTIAEARLYADGEYFLYQCTADVATTVMTDTTERSPTFSLPCFESYAAAQMQEPCAQAYLHISGTPTPADSWRALLGRDPRGLEWPTTAARTGRAAIDGYDFSDALPAKRSARLGCERTAHRIAIERASDHFRFTLCRVTSPEQQQRQQHEEEELLSIKIACGDSCAGVMDDVLLYNILLKVLLNAHSTCLMGINARYEGNVMTYVRPTNNKLIDRAARYVVLLLSRRWQTAKGISAAEAEKLLPSYEAICRRIFEVREASLPSEPVVLKVLESFE